MTVHLETFKGADIQPYTRLLSEMRLKEFRQFPYLYIGNMEDDLAYTQTFSSTPQGRLIVAFQGNQVVGVRSGMPLETPLFFLDRWRSFLQKQGINTKKCFFSGEIVIDPAFQKKGLRSQLMNQYFQEVEAMGFTSIMAITSLRPLDHPLRPQDYVDIDMPRYGFENTNIVLSNTWPTLQADGTVKEQENHLIVWMKNLKAA